MRRPNSTLCILFLLSLVFVSCTKQSTTTTTTTGNNKNKYKDRKPKVLVVHSYDAGNAWTKSLDQPLNALFTANGYSFETVYMNITGNMDENAKVNAGKMAMEKYQSYKPDIVVATDDEAQQYFASALAGFSDVDIVFCGLEGDVALYNYPNTNVTGVLERPQVSNAIRLLQSVAPGVDSFTLLMDNSEASQLFTLYLKGMNLGYNIKIQTVNNFAEWKEQIKNISSKALILFKYDAVNGTTPEGLIKWTAANLSIPSIAFTEKAVQDGILLAIIESGTEQGTLVAKFVSFLEQGRRANQIPISLGRAGYSIVNKKQAEKLKLDFNKLKIDKYYE